MLALFFAMVLALSGCSMVKIDEEMDNAEAVVEFTGGQILKGDAKKEYEDILALYKNAGYNTTGLEDELIDSTLEALAQEEILKKKAEELGVASFDEAELEKAKQAAKETYDEMFQQYRALFVSEDSTDEEIDAETENFLISQNYTLEEVEKSEQRNLWYNSLFEEVTKGVTVTDEALTQAYEQRLADEETNYTEDLSNYEYAVMYGDPVAWVPEGFRAVKHILLKLTDEQSEQLSELEAELDEVDADLQLLDDNEDENVEEFEDVGEDSPEEDIPEEDAPEEDNPEEDVLDEEFEDGEDTGMDPDVMDDDGSLVAEEPTESKEALEAKKADLTKQIEDKKKEFTLALQPKVDEVMAKIDAGEDFDALIEQYGEDPGMQEEPGKTNGYQVHAESTVWDPVFTQAAMSIAEVGGVAVSGLGQNGIHIIRYMNDVQAGPVDMEALRDTLTEELLTELKDTKFEEESEKWMEEANIKYYPQRMK